MTAPTKQRVLAALLKAMTKLEIVAAIAGFGVMTLSISADLISRSIWNTGVLGASHIAVYAMILSAMAGFGLATASGRHLRPKLFESVNPKQSEHISVVFGQVISALILLGLAWFSFKMMQETITFNERDLLLRIAVWPFQGIMGVGFLLSGVRHAIYAIAPDLTPNDKGLAH